MRVQNQVADVFPVYHVDSKYCKGFDVSAHHHWSSMLFEVLAKSYDCALGFQLSPSWHVNDLAVSIDKIRHTKTNLSGAKPFA